jgi:aldose sugar dehydrogenase
MRMPSAGGIVVLLLAGAVAAAPFTSPLAGQPIVGGEIESVMAEVGPVSVQEVVDGFEHPWAIELLPDGRLLVTVRNTGHLHIVDHDGSVSDPVPGTPEAWTQGQGGLMDVALDPDFTANGWIYLTWAMPGEGGATTALGRGRWTGDAIEGFQLLFRQEPFVEGPNHFGNRIVFGPEGHLFLALGERFQFDPAQDLTNHLGTVVRLHPDGSVPEDNPFVGRSDALPEIWSYGHRNIEAAAIHPESGELWVGEMGPLGGDELNRVEAGRNYGWPVVSWGINYDSTPIPDPPTRPEFADAVESWTPVISPSGMLFYDGELFEEWQGDLLIGGLTDQSVVRLEMNGPMVTHEERLPMPARVRDLVQGPDGSLYLVTDEDNGRVLRLAPLQRTGGGS